MKQLISVALGILIAGQITLLVLIGNTYGQDHPIIVIPIICIFITFCITYYHTVVEE